jgi:hypothetical protein
MNQHTWLGIFQHQAQLSSSKPKVQWHEDQTQTRASYQSDQLQFMVQAKPSNTLAKGQTMRHLQMPSDTLYTPPKFGKVKISSVSGHAKSNGQFCWLRLR